MDVAHLRHGLGALEGGLEEKLQASDGGVQVATGDPVFDQVQLIPPQILGTGRIRRLAKKVREVFDDPDVGCLGLRGEFTQRHVFDHALA